MFEALRAYRRACGPRQRLFPGRGSGGPLHVSSAQRAFVKCETAAGVTKAGGIHSPRHAYATHHREAGPPVRELQQHPGHQSLD